MDCTHMVWSRWFAPGFHSWLSLSGPDTTQRPFGLTCTVFFSPCFCPTHLPWKVTLAGSLGVGWCVGLVNRRQQQNIEEKKSRCFSLTYSFLQCCVSSNSLASASSPSSSTPAPSRLWLFLFLWLQPHRPVMLPTHCIVAGPWSLSIVHSLGLTSLC